VRLANITSFVILSRWQFSFKLEIIAKGEEPKAFRRQEKHIHHSIAIQGAITASTRLVKEQKYLPKTFQTFSNLSPLSSKHSSVTSNHREHSPLYTYSQFSPLSSKEQNTAPALHSSSIIDAFNQCYYFFLLLYGLIYV
jgi:hypothetical protein